MIACTTDDEENCNYFVGFVPFRKALKGVVELLVVDLSDVYFIALDPITGVESIRSCS